MWGIVGGARRPRIPVGRATEVLHKMGVERGPRVALGLQDWLAYSPGGCRNGGHTALEVARFVGKGALTRPTPSSYGKRLSGTESLQKGAAG